MARATEVRVVHVSVARGGSLIAHRGRAYTRGSMNMQRIARRQKAIRTPKAAAIAGIVFALLLGTAMVLIWVAVPVDSRRAGDWVLDDSSRRSR